MSNMPVVWLGTKWIYEDAWFPVYMEDNAGVAKTGLIFSDVTVRWADSATGMAAFIPTAPQWVETGFGHYMMFVPSAANVIQTEGPFELYITTVAAGNKEFRGFAQIEQRDHDLLLNELTAIHTGAGTVGKAIIDASEHFEVFVNPAYDDVTDTITFMIWMQRNGITVLTPTSCRVIVKEEGVTTILDIVNASPNADGFFKIQSSPVVLNPDKVFEVVGRVVYAAITYESGNAMTTFN